MKKLATLILTFVIVNGYSQLEVNGKCFFNCKIPIKREVKFSTKFIYTGSDFENPYVEKKITEMRKELTSPASTKWLKKAGNQNCLSQDPNDCLVWCLVDVPAQYRYVAESTEYIVLDTSKVKEFEVLTTKIEPPLEPKYYEKSTEVLCKENITKELIKAVEQKLIEDGYELKLSNKQKLTSNTEEALEAFQEEYNLPIGKLNISTLENMGINVATLKK
jgi:hypothetical protein